MLRSTMNLCAALLVPGALLLVSASCVKRVDPTSAATRETPEGKACPPAEGAISDGEANNNQVNPVKGRGGYWYVFSDKQGSEVTPLPGDQGGTFAMSEGGAKGTKYAARMHGTVGSGEPVYAGMGFNFVDPKGQYDASKYKGVSFWAKKGPGSIANVRLKVPDVATDPDGKQCSDCFNDFGADLTLTEEWQQFTIPFHAMKQMKGWGSPHPDGIDAKTLYGMQFQVNEKGGKFDIWVDEIEFTGCQ
jgi:endoglucanase